MSTIDAIVSMLEAMSEDARIKVYEFTKQLFTAGKPANLFTPIGTSQVISDLAKSRRQIAEGKGLDMKEALKEIGEKHGMSESKFSCRL